MGDTNVDYQLIRAATEGNRFSILSPVNIKMAIELAGEVFECTDLTMPFVKATYTQVDDPSLAVACGLFGFNNSINPNVSFDWSKDPNNSMSNINKFVSARTKGMINEMLTSEPMGPVVVSALYFKGSWVRPFKEHNTTRNWTFNGLKGKVPVDMMRSFPGEYDKNHQQLKTKFIETSNLKSVVLPYIGDRFVAVLTLPIDEKEVIQNTFRAPEFYNEWSQHLKLNGMKSLSVQYFVPKFKKEFTYKDMPAILKAAGFDFDTFSARSSISEVIHKVVIDVDEVGTTASAATTLVAKGGPAVDKYWYGDRPFVLSIVDVVTASIVFGGIVDFS
jgi:serpin B